jgi:dCMP deaminase
MIVILLGKPGAGVSTVAEHLIEKGFVHLALEDELIAEAGRRKLQPTSQQLHQLSQDLKQVYGPQILAEWVKLKMRNNQDYVITGIQETEELAILSKKATLVTVTADAKKRFTWLKKRGLDRDPEKQAHFQQYEKSYNGALERKATIVIKNTSSLQALQQKVTEFVQDLKKEEHHRPSWDQYFLDIAKAVSRRATCDRGRTAVVIVKDKRILCTGYVGSPMGVPHCDEVGHKMKKVIHEDGRMSQHCVRTSHAEQNALALAARNGVAVEGATIYSKMVPCYTCAKMIINAGIKRVVCLIGYHGAVETPELLVQAGVKLEVRDENIEQYANQ